MEADRGPQRVRPGIVETHQGFEPPVRLRGMLDELLDAVPQNYLIGLETLVLTNQAALSRDQRRQKTWSRNHKIRLAGARGWYTRATRTSRASISLLVDNIMQSEQSRVRRIPILRYEALGMVLFHEIGHHIHAAHRPVFKEKEDVAEDWSRRLFARFLRIHYWYLLPLFYLVAIVRCLPTPFKVESCEGKLMQKYMQ